MKDKRTDLTKQFFEWVSDKENINKARKALAKNTTFNPDIFDDVFQDTIIKVYNAIRNGNDIRDFKNYFFISLKFNYIIKDNQTKNNQKKIVRFDWDDVDKYDRIDDSDIEELELNDKIENMAYEKLRAVLIKTFSQFEADIFLNYSLNKLKNGAYSYKTVAKYYGLDLKEVARIILKIKKWLVQSEEIQKIKNQLKNYANN